MAFLIGVRRQNTLKSIFDITGFLFYCYLYIQLPPKITLVHLSYPFLVNAQYLAILFSDVAANSQTIFEINVLFKFAYFSFCSFPSLQNSKRLKKQPKYILEAEIFLFFLCTTVLFSPFYCLRVDVRSDFFMAHFDFSGFLIHLFSASQKSESIYCQMTNVHSCCLAGWLLDSTYI